MMPYERIYATGFVWRAAVLKPRKMMVVVGIYLYFLPTFLYSVLMLKLIFSGIHFEYLNGAAMVGALAALAALAALMVPSVLSLLILILTTSNYVKAKRHI